MNLTPVPALFSSGDLCRFQTDFGFVGPDDLCLGGGSAWGLARSAGSARNNDVPVLGRWTERVLCPGQPTWSFTITTHFLRTIAAECFLPFSRHAPI